jgi:hypothetical protein
MVSPGFYLLKFIRWSPQPIHNLGKDTIDQPDSDPTSSPPQLLRDPANVTPPLALPRLSSPLQHFQDNDIKDPQEYVDLRNAEPVDDWIEDLGTGGDEADPHIYNPRSHGSNIEVGSQDASPKSD